MKIKPIRIGRFVLTKMTAADAGKYYQLSNNSEVMKYVTGYALSREESDNMLRGMLLEYGADTYLGRYLIEEAATGELIGAAKLDQIDADIEIGYRIRKEYWGKGIATEIALGLARFGKNKLKAKAVIAFVNTENLASVRVLEKVGMIHVQTIEDIDEIKYKFIYSPKQKFPMKKALYIILGLIAVVFIAALIMPKDYAVEREVVIQKPNAIVFDYLKSLKNQNKWSVWAKRDPNMKASFEGTDGTVGFISKWQGNDDVGSGEQEIVNIEEGKRVNTQLRFLEPMESTSDAYLITEPVDSSSTKVRWGFAGKMPIPMNVMMPFMGMDNMLGKDFQDGLNNLKSILESK